VRMGIVYLFKQDVGNVEKLRGRKDVLGLIKVLQSKSDSEVRIKAEKSSWRIRRRNSGRTTHSGSKG